MDNDFYHVKSNVTLALSDPMGFPGRAGYMLRWPQRTARQPKKRTVPRQRKPSEAAGVGGSLAALAAEWRH